MPDDGPEDDIRGDPAETGFDHLRPLYEQAKKRLRAGIDSGLRGRHEFLPTEPELCERLGVSRITIRCAVSDLCDEGLLRRQQGRGTVVASHRRRQELVVLAGFADLLQGSDELIEHRVLERHDEAEEPEAARAFGRTEWTRLPRFLRLIIAGGRSRSRRWSWSSAASTPSSTGSARAGRCSSPCATPTASSPWRPTA